MLACEEHRPLEWGAGPRPFFAWQEKGTTQVRDDNLGSLAGTEKVHNSSEAYQGVVARLGRGKTTASLRLLAWRPGPIQQGKI